MPGPEVNHKWEGGTREDPTQTCKRCSLRRRREETRILYQLEGIWMPLRKVPPCDARPKSER